MKKQLFSLALATALGLSLTACSGGSASSTPAASTAPAASAPAETASADSDWSYVSGNGTLKIGYTLFEPMNYIGEDGQLTGFETEFAQAVCAKLGVEPEFVEINWDSKVLELESKNIDCIWNGMTITPELEEALSISDPYIKNYQVVVIRSADADKYTDTASLSGANLEAEAGSAGEAAIQDDADLSQASYTSVLKQTDALLEVKSGAADAAVMDFVLANALAGTGDYSDLTVIPDLELSVEEYGIGFRKGSDVTEKVNEAMQELIDDGTLNDLAVKYELGDLLLANQK
ncbi:transporter substrate-binding domain-containing protein [Pseudoflavonifractor sp. MSJ-37]|uniref:transporter substrate-binding domain-containing protein n=1 Tax=Pseudoflavonifractor sp. MSJ-37 TaxID=2841531 RepID=UPI001C11F801|nr:transporter substrate-binding domain-containing protein [Pseudoflavonifractor sp. MSJ-37]MBU5434982.1 transporter substrate-binding domain-containing protein [Pseudoflavonifractor sp. MSJ-37]